MFYSSNNSSNEGPAKENIKITRTPEDWNQRSQAIKFLLFYGRLHFFPPFFPRTTTTTASTHHCQHPLQHPLSSSILVTGIQSFAVKLNVVWIKFYIWREIAFRCGPALFGPGMPCGSGLAILVQTGVCSALMKHIRSSGRLRRSLYVMYSLCLELKRHVCIFFLSSFFFFRSSPLLFFSYPEPWLSQGCPT